MLLNKVMSAANTRFRCICFILILCPFVLSAQLRISEIAAAGSTLQDEDQEYPDWIELENIGNQPISLLNYALSDNAGQPVKWKMPDVMIDPGGHRVVFASGKTRPASPDENIDLIGVQHWETAIQDGSQAKYIIGSAAVPSNWKNPAFVPSGWYQGTSGFGYGDSDDQTIIPTGTLTVYARFKFNVADKSKIKGTILNMDFDDGFVAYLNGVEIARTGLTGTPPLWSETAASHEAVLYLSGIPSAFPLDVSMSQNLLQDGENVLAVEIHNFNSGSNDLTMRPFLHFGMANGVTMFGPNPNWFAPSPGYGPAQLHSNFKLSKGETLFLYTPAGLLADSVTIRKDLQVGHVMARLPDSWCISKTPTPNALNTGTCYSGYAAAPQFNLEPGFYADNQNLVISGSGLHYTVNGTLPNLSAPAGSGNITLTQSTCVRAQATESGKLPSEVVSRSYFIREKTKLPVVSITAVPADFFSIGANAGIYDDYNSGLKAPCHVEYFDAGKTLRASDMASAKIVGNFSKAFAQKSMQFVFEEDFGAHGDIPNVLFGADKPNLGKLHGFRVRNMDDDAGEARMRDVIANRTGLQTHAAATASQNVAVFINGKYWGHYVAREMLNEYYMRDNVGADPDSVDIIKTHVGNTFADAGSIDQFNNLYNYLTTHNLAQADAFEQVRAQADLENWADYWATEVFTANGDWYSSSFYNNIECFRDFGTQHDNRWKFLIWDTNVSQDLGDANTLPSFNSLNYALTNPATANIYTPMFNSLLNNAEYKRYFINRFADLMNTIWKPTPIKDIIEANRANVATEIKANYNRWKAECGGFYCPIDSVPWAQAIAKLKAFYDTRPGYQRTHLISHFNLTKSVDITLHVQPPGAGVVKISTVTPDVYPWTGKYFDGNPVTVTAIANPGYTFTGWSPNGFITNPDSSAFTTNVSTNTTTFTANFYSPAAAVELTCSEINYNSDPSTASGNWIELHHYGSGSLNLSGYQLQKQGGTEVYVIPSGTTLGADAYLVLADDLTQFQQAHPNVNNVLGPTMIGLGNNGDTLEFRDPAGTLVLTIGYNDGNSWPQCADGYGRTLESAQPNTQSDLLSPGNWFNGCMRGSPGKAYSPCQETLIFNEINYKSPTTTDAGDWVELWNKTGQTLDLSAWQFRDSRDTLRFTFPSGTVLQPDSFLVIYSNLANFEAVHGAGITNKVGPFLFSLDGNGEVIRLFNPFEILHLSMYYDDSAPWPTAPDGTGPTLELKAPFTDLNLGQNWGPSCNFGTPGRFNSPCATPTFEVNQSIDLRIIPNPNNGQCTVILPAEQSAEQWNWELLAANGRLAASGRVPEGQSEWALDMNNLPGGAYVLVLRSERYLVHRKLVRL
jgi:hypothetical protein